MAQNNLNILFIIIAVQGRHSDQFFRTNPEHDTQH